MFILISIHFHPLQSHHHPKKSKKNCKSILRSSAEELSFIQYSSSFSAVIRLWYSFGESPPLHHHRTTSPVGYITDGQIDRPTDRPTWPETDKDRAKNFQLTIHATKGGGRSLYFCSEGWMVGIPNWICSRKMVMVVGGWWQWQWRRAV